MFSDWRFLRRLDRSIVLFLAAWAFIAFGYFGIQGVLLNLYLLRLDFDPQFIGVLTASGQLVWAAVALPAGALGRRIGLREALFLGSVLCAVGMGLLLLVEGFPRPVWNSWLVGCWITLWIGAALNTVNSVPYLMSVASVETRGHAFSAQAAVIPLAGFAGSVAAGLLPGVFMARFGGSLEQPDPYRLALWVAPLAYTLAALTIASARPVRTVEQGEARTKSARPWGLFIFLGLIIFLQTACEGSALTFFNIYLDTGLQVPPARIGAVFGVAQLLPVFVALVTPQLLSKFGSARTFALATVVASMALLALAAIPHWAPAGIGFMVVLGMGAVYGPARNILSQEMVLPEWRTTTSAIATIGLALGWASMAAIGGYVIAALGFRPLFLISAASGLLSATITLGYARWRSRRVGPGRQAVV